MATKNREPRICPKCGREYDEAPALSRKDGRTAICPECGITEALEDYESGIIAQTAGKAVRGCHTF